MGRSRGAARVSVWSSASTAKMRDMSELRVRCISWGRIMEEKGHLDKAKSKYRASLRMQRRIHGKHGDHPGIASALYQLGRILEEKEDLDGAETHYRMSLRMMQRIVNADDPVIAALLHELGTILEKKGDFDGAESQHRANLCMQQRMHDEDGDHLDVASSLHQLGLILQKKGDLDGGGVEVLREPQHVPPHLRRRC